MNRLKIFIEGWKNNLLPAEDEKELIEMISKERMKVCNACPHISTKHKSIRPDVHCVKCSCTLAAKTRAFEAGCPLQYWVAINKNDYEQGKQQ
jgi:hypothetical protein